MCRKAKILVRCVVLGVCLSLASCAGDSYETEVKAALAAQLRADDISDGVGGFNDETYECVSERVIEDIGTEELKSNGVTPANARERFAEGGIILYTSAIRFIEVAVTCMDSSELASALAPTYSSADVELYECVVADIGDKRAGELLVEYAVSGWDEAQVADEIADCRESVEDAASASQADNDTTESASATTTTTTAPTTTTESKPAFENFVSEAPPMVATYNRRPNGKTRLDSFGSDVPEGPSVPLAYVGSVGGDALAYEADLGQLPSVSPDGSVFATYASATAISDDTYSFISLSTGQEIEQLTFDSKGARVDNLQWSPDGQAVVFDSDPTDLIFYRIGSGRYQSPRGRYFGMAFASDDTATSAFFCGPNQAGLVIIFDDGTTDEELLPGCQSVIQAQDSSGTPYVLYLDADQALQRIDPGQKARIVVSDADTARTLRSCNGVVVAANHQGEAVVYETGSGLSASASSVSLQGCPVPSQNGSKVAYRKNDESVHVLDLATGNSVEVAISGEPWSFDETGEEVLITGGGTFIVKADGSGGAPASVEAVRSNRYSFCRAGNSGRGLMQTESGVVLFDVGSDSAVELPVDEISASCLVTLDENWLLTAGWLVDLQNSRAVDLHGIDLVTEEPIRDGARSEGRRVDEFMWSGPQKETVSQIASS